MVGSRVHDRNNLGLAFEGRNEICDSAVSQPASLERGAVIAYDEIRVRGIVYDDVRSIETAEHDEMTAAMRERCAG